MRYIVTGAAGVLGHAVVQRLPGVALKIACIDRVKDDHHPSCECFIADDLADRDLTFMQMTKAIEWLGGVDALIHLVGAFEWKMFEESMLDDWRLMFRTNVETTINTIQAVLPHMKRGSAIVLVGAASAEPAGVGMASYAAAKSSIARICDSLSQELRPRGIRINSVRPAIIDTPRNRADMPDANFLHWTGPDAIADAIYFLVSPASRAVNGVSLDVTNGGE